MEREMALKREEATQRLREAIVGLREARQRMCTSRRSQDCDLVDLSSIELTLLDLETRYRRLASDSFGTPKAADKLKKVQDLAADARSKVSDLSAAIDEATKQ